MRCERVGMGKGVFAFVCGPRRRQPSCSVFGCGRPSVALCDFPTPRGKHLTCDAKLCSEHRRPVPGMTSFDRDDQVDVCPEHERELARRRLQLRLPGV